MTLHDLSTKDVIQLKTGENLGRIDDLVFIGEQITQAVLRGRPQCSACWEEMMICSFHGLPLKPLEQMSS